MSQSVVSNLPNYDLKVVKSNKFEFVGYIDSVHFEHMLSGLELDVMLILVHLQLQESGLVYFNTDDILEFRNKKRKIYADFSRAGFARTLREGVFWALWGLKQKGYIDFYTYNKYNFEAKVNVVGKKYKINSKLLSLNPYKQEWLKMFGYFLEKNSDKKQIQVKKILGTVSKNSLSPCQIRDRFEETLDELCSLKIISDWRYKKIDEDELHSKGWLKRWKTLSVYIYP